ncbi:MAG: DDE-type integrase/transposase/recombinase [Rickettsiales bacterium]|nr:DDE-type integrase/transposase/recombinase [Rickettsiales bacterium]
MDKDGNTVGFYLSITHNINTAKRFLSKALKSTKKYAHPSTINADRNSTYSDKFCYGKRRM